MIKTKKVNNLKKLKIIISICLILIWMAVIFGFSSKSGDESNVQSKSIIESVADATNVKNSKQIDNKDETHAVPKTSIVMDKLNKIVRKCAHASIYFVLSIFVMNLIFLIKKEKKFRYYILVILICFLYACTDEYHQLYVPGRTGSFTDALIDTAGASIGCLLVWICCMIKSKIKRK